MNVLGKIKNAQGRKILAIKLLVSILISLGFAIILEKKYFSLHHLFYTADRIVILTGILFFIVCHAIFKINKMYTFIFKKRYLLAVMALLFVVCMKYSGSSITNYSNYIQPNIISQNDTTIFGQARAIRSDEWVVSTQYALSQNMTPEKCSYYSTNARATDTDMFSSINAPIKDITSLGKPFNIGFILFGNDIGLSFWWYGRLIALLLVSFELSMLITNKNKLASLCGMLLITCSSAVQWWFSTSLVDMLIFGQLAIILIDLFMTTNKQRTKILCAIGLFISAISYVFVFYPAWQITLGYVFLALFIWVIYKNRKIYKINLKDIITILLVILAVAGIGIRYYCMSKDTLNIIMNTSYPGERFETGGKFFENLFSYVYSMFFAYSDTVNPCEYSGMLSLFPIPMLIAIIYMIRNKKGTSFLLPLLGVSIIYTIWVTVGTPELFAKFSLLYMVEARRMTIPLGLTQIYIMLYLIANIKKETKILSEKITLPLAFIFALLILKMALDSSPAGYIGVLKGFIGGSFVLVSVYYLLNLQEQKNKNYLIAILILLSLYAAVLVNPIIKGTGVIYQKPFSKKVQEIVMQNQDSIWIAESMGVVGGNYLLSNGAKVINSTNIYPNEELYEVILKDKKEENKEIWNRYAHISIQLVKTETKLDLVQPDSINIELNYEQLKDLNVKYIASYRNTLEEFNSTNIQFENVYEEDGCVIYSVKY